MMTVYPTHVARGGSCYADADAAREALDLVRPMVEAMLRDARICGAGSCCVVVLDPALTPTSGTSFHDAVLVEDDFGTRERWDADYASFARAKARTAWTHGEGGAVLQSVRPHLLREGESLLRGAVRLDGIVVAASGCFPWYDEALATAVAAALRAVAMARSALAIEGGAVVAGA